MTARANGFTLVELLVSLAIFALISVLLFGGFRFGLRAWESGSDRVDRSSQVELVQNLLRRELAVAIIPRPRRAINDVRQPAPPFLGARDTLSFIGTMPLRTDPASRYVLTLTADRGPAPTGLMLTWKPFRADTPRGAQDEAGEQAGETDLLLDDVAGVEFSYFGVYDRSRPADWVAEWADPRSLPQLVRVRVTFPRGDPRRWPDLVIAPRFAQ